jgi:hypothetical protein
LFTLAEKTLHCYDYPTRQLEDEIDQLVLYMPLAFFNIYLGFACNVLSQKMM